MARTRRTKRADAQGVDRTGQRKVTMWIDVELAKRLRHAAVEDEREIGQVASAGIELALAGRYWTDRRRPASPPARPAIAAGTEPERAAAEPPAAPVPEAEAG